MSAVEGRFARAAPMLSVLAFVLGFLWDAFTLRRVDQVADNLLLLGYLLALGACLAIDQRVESQLLTSPRWERWLPRLRFAAQFFAGGLWSAYVIFFFKSASRVPAWLFTSLLVFVLLLNEFVDGLQRRQRVRSALFAFCAHAFFLFFVPVMTGVGGWPVVLFAGSLSLLMVAAVAFAGSVRRHRSPERIDATWTPGEEEDRLTVRLLVRDRVRDAAAVIGALLVLEWAEVIPPVPLAVVERGVFHNIERRGEDYVLRYEEPPWYAPMRADDRPFRFREGDSVFLWSAVFAPRRMSLAIQHRWTVFDERAGSWVERDRLPFTVVGGRDGGFRGYTKKSRVEPGRWRVHIERADGRELGRVDFDIVQGGAEPPQWVERLR